MFNLSTLKKRLGDPDIAYALIVLSILVLWSSAYIGIRHALVRYSPENLAFLRYLTASAAFGIVSIFNKVRLPALKDLAGISAIGFLNFTLYNLLLNYGETRVGAGTSSLIINMGPFISLLIAVITKQEIAAKSDWLSFMIAFAGVSLIVVSMNAGLNTFSWHALLILGAAICHAVGFSIQKNYLIRYTALELTSYGIWIGTGFLAIFTDQPFKAISSAPLSQTITVLYLGIFPGAIAFFFMGLALKKYTLSRVSGYLFLIPFFTVFIAWIIIDEVIRPGALCGGILIISGILFKNRKSRPPEAVAEE